MICPVPASTPMWNFRRDRRVRVPCFSTNQDRKSTRLNSSHVESSYAVFCLKKKNPVLLGPFIGDYFDVFAKRGIASVHYTPNYQFVTLVAQGLPTPLYDSYLPRAEVTRVQ